MTLWPHTLWPHTVLAHRNEEVYLASLLELAAAVTGVPVAELQSPDPARLVRLATNPTEQVRDGVMHSFVQHSAVFSTSIHQGLTFACEARSGYLHCGDRAATANALPLIATVERLA